MRVLDLRTATLDPMSSASPRHRLRRPLRALLPERRASAGSMFIALMPLLVALCARAQHVARRSSSAGSRRPIAWLLMVPWVVRVMSHYGGLPYIVGVLLFVAMCARTSACTARCSACSFSASASASASRRWLLVAAGVGGGRVRAHVSAHRLSVEPHRRGDRRLHAADPDRSRGRAVLRRRR